LPVVVQLSPQLLLPLLALLPLVLRQQSPSTVDLARTKFMV
jgi:hypothetical protein